MPLSRQTIDELIQARHFAPGHEGPCAKAPRNTWFSWCRLYRMHRKTSAEAGNAEDLVT